MSSRSFKQLSTLFFVIILQHACFVRISSFPHRSTNENGNDGDGDMEIITVEEIVHESKANFAKNLTAALITPNNGPKTSSKATNAQNEASNEALIDTADDLIFLGQKPQHYDASEEEQSRLKQLTPTTTMGNFQQIDLLTCAEEDSLTAIFTSVASNSSEEQINTAIADNDAGSSRSRGGFGGAIVGATTSPPIKHVIADNVAIIVDEDDDDDNVDGDGDSEAVDASIDVSQNDDDEVNVDDKVDISVAVASTIPPIDMSDFISLIPFGTVKSIASNYYRNDPEVQRAYAYLNSADFVIVRQHFIVLPEVKAFLRYLNNSGLDVVDFLYTLTNLTRKPDELLAEDNLADDVGSGSDAVIGNEIENGIKLNQMTITSPLQPEATTTRNVEEAANGLHGLVDSVLDVLPQDQILATFFEKLESNEQFTRLVEKIGQPAFAKILHNLQNSAQLRTLVFTLHNHGIFITRIVDSLKSYFLLGTFSD